MLGRLTLIFCWFVLLLLRSCFVRAEEFPAGTAEPTAAPRQMLVLRNGEVISGEVHRQDDRYEVVGNDSEVALPVRDVDFMCHSLDEAYRVQQGRTVAGHIEDHLNLAEWCLRHDLTGYAAAEIAAAMEIDPQNRRLVLLDRRLRLSIEEAARPKVAATGHTKSALPATAEELERMVRSLPSGTAETFTATIQPMLLNYCATAGCHGPNASSKYTLLRPALGKLPLVRVNQRNLYNTLQWINHDKPAESKLLKAAAEPHGLAGTTPNGVLDSTKNQELIAWVLQVGQGVKSTPISNSSVLAGEQVPTKSRSILATPYSPPGSIGSAVTPIAPINPKTVLTPPTRIVPSSRTSAPPTKLHKSPVSAAQSDQLTAPAQAAVPERPIVTPASTNGDEIPNANEVLP